MPKNVTPVREACLRKCVCDSEASASVSQISKKHFPGIQHTADIFILCASKNMLLLLLFKKIQKRTLQNSMKICFLVIVVKYILINVLLEKG